MKENPDENFSFELLSKGTDLWAVVAKEWNLCKSKQTTPKMKFLTDSQIDAVVEEFKTRKKVQKVPRVRKGVAPPTASRAA